MLINELIKLNPDLNFKELDEQSFREYGKIISGYDFADMLSYMERETLVPEEGNIYKASVSELEAFPVFERLTNEFYGEMPIQAGYCNGRNSSLNGLEYHIGSEIDVAVTDLVLLLGKLQDVIDGRFRSEDVTAFLVLKGTALQLYETTLHFSPCKTSSDGFKCIVVLPRGTNEPLHLSPNPSPQGRGVAPLSLWGGAGGEARLLFARNKWLLAHPERKNLMEKGAWSGITGDNIEIRIN